ncbi:MAG: RHS domain-containing protein, partial [Methyloprofundus sp.]|nr:RHS domain-containing protein [Methyloprofundus sp.]
GQVKEVSISGITAGQYVYNANNQRTQKIVNGVTTHYIYGAGGLLYGEYDANGNLIREYVYLNGEPLAQIDAGTSEDLSYLHTDHLGTPRYASNTTGVQVWSWQSDAFGNGAPSGSTMVNLRFAGQYWDNESSLHYNWNRYYDPETGRYITSDPIGLEGGLNTFAYVSANPVMFTDPEGLDVEITITRQIFTSTSITSFLLVSSTEITDTFEGYVLEDRVGGSCACKDPISPGTYNAFVRSTGKNGWRIELENVPNYENVQIHRGNNAKDVEGCFAAGTSRAANFVSNSRAAMNRIQKIVEMDGGKITVNVIGNASRAQYSGNPPIPGHKPF